MTCSICGKATEFCISTWNARGTVPVIYLLYIFIAKNWFWIDFFPCSKISADFFLYMMWCAYAMGIKYQNFVDSLVANFSVNTGSFWWRQTAPSVGHYQGNLSKPNTSENFTHNNHCTKPKIIIFIRSEIFFLNI